MLTILLAIIIYFPFFAKSEVGYLLPAIYAIIFSFDIINCVSRLKKYSFKVIASIIGGYMLIIDGILRLIGVFYIFSKMESILFFIFGMLSISYAGVEMLEEIKEKKK